MRLALRAELCWMCWRSIVYTRGQRWWVGAGDGGKGSERHSDVPFSSVFGGFIILNKSRWCYRRETANWRKLSDVLLWSEATQQNIETNIEFWIIRQKSWSLLQDNLDEWEPSQTKRDLMSAWLKYQDSKCRPERSTDKDGRTKRRHGWCTFRFVICKIIIPACAVSAWCLRSFYSFSLCTQKQKEMR